MTTHPHDDPGLTAVLDGADPDDLFAFIRPATPAPATPRRTCLACGLFLPQARPPLCEGCHNDAGLAARVVARLAALSATQEALHAEWSAYLAALPAELDERWQKLTTARALATNAAYRPFGMDSRRNALPAFQRRLAATEKQGGPLAEVIRRERDYLDALAACASEQARWERVKEATTR